MTRCPRFAILAAVSLLSLAACSRQAEQPADNIASGNDAMADDTVRTDAGGNGAASARSFAFAGGDGAPRGGVSVSEDASGASMIVNASAMPVGVHGIHLHEKGLCDGPKFESAGAHWNPSGKKHGRDNPAGAHLGDLPNLEVGASGAGMATLTVAGATIANGTTMLADADGTSIVIHAKADDYKTDPSGASGDRIACAVIAPPK